MPEFTYQDEENTPQEIITGDYPFEILDAEFSICKGKKCSGSDQIDLKLMAYADDTFTTKLTQIWETIILHPKCQWRLDTFLKSANLLIDGKPPVKGQAINFCPEIIAGLRGWASFAPESDNKTPPTMRTKVKVWITNKSRLERLSPEGF